ncbi:MAG: hypothetical protein IPJ74_04680 [Saprospiraceae bacterium]|nr:hypothetical protein [Saprospiraceae bacterium]
MAQHNWAYTSVSGKQYVVGLYHGAESGHLMVYCNLSVIYIDFSVLQNWKYSFFIEDDLLELKIERQNGGFHYGFDVNRQADTPRNRERKVQEQQDRRKVIFLSVGIVAMIIIGIAVWRYNEIIRPKAQRTELLTKASNLTIAKVFFNESSEYLTYSFVANGNQYKHRVHRSEYTKTHALPLEPGDEFLVKYAYTHPKINEINFERPTDRQIQRYHQRVLEHHTHLHPELDKKYISCILELAFEEKGLDGYADFYYQNITSDKNPYHNQDTYGRLVRDIPFQQSVEERCK